jgi:hypothetical protein
MSRLKIRMAACNIWSLLQESATVEISCYLTVRKQAFLMTQLLQKYLDYLPAHIPNTYPVTKLQDESGTNDYVIHVVCPGSTAVGSDIE